MSCNRLTSEDYVYYALGTLDEPETAQLRAHLRAHCEVCLAEVRDAFQFWYIFAALTERTQGMSYPEPSAQLRERVINIARRSARPKVVHPAPMRVWMRVAAGVLISIGVTGLSWRVGRLQVQKNVVAAEARIQRQSDEVRKLESENKALQNLVLAARNAPAVFPGKDGIVSVQDPYILRDLQQARQTQVAMSQALSQERTRAGELEKRLTQTSTLLAAATREKEAADRQYQKAYDAAIVEKERGVNQLSGEIASYKSKVHELESEVVRYHTAMNLQQKGLSQQLQLISLMQSRNVALIHLHAADAGQTGSGVALIGDNSRLAFFPANLPPVQPGHAYQLWLIRDKATISAGTFSGDAKGAPALQLANEDLISGVKSFAVTEEPAGGSTAPTGHKILIGSSKL